MEIQPSLRGVLRDGEGIGHYTRRNLEEFVLMCVPWVVLGWLSAGGLSGLFM